jgi:uncharacterized protein YbbK (DUF523 family)
MKETIDAVFRTDVAVSHTHKAVRMIGKILVSACLTGAPVRYDGRAKTIRDTLLDQWRAEGRLVIVCPEVAAGFPVPRRPAEIRDRRDGQAVLAHRATIEDDAGNDVTNLFLAGAQLALERARAERCRYAILADGSPSCGSTFIYDGTFSSTKHAGAGVTAALLRNEGLHVFAPEQIAELAALIAAEEA